jgi:hypothetical protein
MFSVVLNDIPHEADAIIVTRRLHLERRYITEMAQRSEMQVQLPEKPLIAK